MTNIKMTYEERFNNNDDFKRKEINDIVTFRLNFTRATFKEAQQFRNIVVEDIAKNKRKIIIDLSECDYIDSTFLGALVIILKKASEIDGEIKFVKPSASALALFRITGLYNIFNMYVSEQDALDSFDYPGIETLQ